MRESEDKMITRIMIHLIVEHETCNPNEIAEDMREHLGEGAEFEIDTEHVPFARDLNNIGIKILEVRGVRAVHMPLDQARWEVGTYTIMPGFKLQNS